jgi:phosphorylated adapter RNA export protein
MEETDNNNIHDAIYGADNLEDDVDMIDVEEGEFVESNSQNVLGQSSVGDIIEVNQETRSENSKCGASKKKKKNKRKRKGAGSGSNVINIDRFNILLLSLNLGFSWNFFDDEIW